MYVCYPYLWATSELLSHLTEVVSSPPNTPQNLRIPVKLRPEPRRQPYKPESGKNQFHLGVCSSMSKLTPADTHCECLPILPPTPPLLPF